MSMRMLVGIVMLVAMGMGVCHASEKKSETVTGDIYLRMPSTSYQLSLSDEVSFIEDETAKASLSVYPFRGLDSKHKKGVFKLNRSWFEEQINGLLDFYLKHAGENLFKPSKSKAWHMLYFCRAFINELDQAYDGKGAFKNRAELSKQLTDKYIEQALIYASKFKVQKRARKAPKFRSLVKVLQPMMAVFMYGNPWIAMSECYRTSDKFSKGKKVYREYFLNVEVMTVMRRRYRIDASERDLNASILKMEDVVFLEYQRECARRWVDEKQYAKTKYEKAKKVSDIPKDLRAGPLDGAFALVLQLTILFLTTPSAFLSSGFIE